MVQACINFLFIFFYLNRNLKRYFFTFFCTSKTSFSNIILTISKSCFLRIAWLYLEKNISTSANTHFVKKKKCLWLFSPKLKFQTFVFHFFSNFRNLFIKSDSSKVKKNHLRMFKLLPEKNYLLWASMHFFN